MGLSNDLISQFVKVTKDTDEKKRSTTVYGTIVKIGETTGVMLDGSEVVTPVSTLADYYEGDRVMVSIDNHAATITGNITSPSARVDDVNDMGDRIEANEAEINNLYANRVTTDYLKANYAEIGQLDVAKARITDLEARSANIEELKADKAEIDELDTKYASIGELDAVKANITSLDSKYVNINFANIDEAAIKNFYAKFGMMEDVIISNGTVTGKLVGVTINGDLIQAGTLVADKLVIRTEDGLLYKLNAEALGEAGLAQIEDLETLKNGLHGAIINDKTIVAEKIKVDDLVAFGATIGGFKIDSDAIHSTVKESVDNTTRGIYMDNDGQFNVGDSNNFLKFYKDTDGTYKLAISADQMTFGSSRKNLETALNEVASGSISGVDVEYLASDYTTEPLAIRTFSGVANVVVNGHKGTRMRGYLDSDNKLLMPYLYTTQWTKNGVTFQTNPDGSVSIWGTPTSDSYIDFWLRASGTGYVDLSEGTYTMSLESNKSIGSSVLFGGNNVTDKVVLNAAYAYPARPVRFTLTSGIKQCGFLIRVLTSFSSATEDDPVIVYPMINEGSTVLPFTIPKIKNASDTEATIPETEVTFNGGSSSSVQGSVYLSSEECIFDIASSDQWSFSSELKYRIVLKAGVTAADSDWSTDAPAWKNGTYIWSRTKTTSADGTVSYSNPVCITGNTGAAGTSGTNGRSVGSIVNYYLVSDQESGITNLTRGWDTDIPSMTSTDKYLWNYEEIFDTTDSLIARTDPCIIGVYGDTGAAGKDGKDGTNGKGISSITEYYKATSSTTAPSSWDTTVPTLTSTNKYLWNYETIAYTDGTSTDSKKRIIGVYGDTGKNGTNGKDGTDGAPGEQGIGVSSIVEQYYLSTSETELAGGSWSSEQPKWSPGSYIWTRSYITWSDDTTSTTTPVLAEAANSANTNAANANAKADDAKDAADDAKDSADDAKTAANDAKNAADDAKQTADNAYSEITKLNDAIKNLVVGKDGSTLMTQTENGWQFNFGNFKDTIDDIGKKTAYVNVDETDAGNPRIELGKAGNDSKLALTNEDIQFVVGSEIPTRVTNKGIETDQIQVDNELSVGKFVWKVRANGNLGLSWKGADS